MPITSTKHEIEIPAELAGMRLDQALAKLLPQYSRGRLQHWIKLGQVSVNNKVAHQTQKVQVGQQISLDASLEIEEHAKPQAIALSIVYEDTSLLIINKPAGLVVHPGAGNQDNTLVNALLHYAPELAQLPRAGIIHRLDKETSGLLIVARNVESYHFLTQQMQQRNIKREYLTIVQGNVISSGTINASIGRHPTQRTKMAVTAKGRPAVTHYQIIEKFRTHTYLKVALETGRTHQIRVHLAHIKHPVVGDPQYSRTKIPRGGSENLKNALQQFKRQALHAFYLQLTHPLTNELLHWQIELPDDMTALLKLLEADKQQNSA